MAFCAKFVLSNLSNKMSYDEKDTWSIAFNILGVLYKSQLGITSAVH